jgi:hypothetical protein
VTELALGAELCALPPLAQIKHVLRDLDLEHLLLTNPKYESLAMDDSVLDIDQFVALFQDLHIIDDIRLEHMRMLEQLSPAETFVHPIRSGAIHEKIVRDQDLSEAAKEVVRVSIRHWRSMMLQRKARDGMREWMMTEIQEKLARMLLHEKFEVWHLRLMTRRLVDRREDLRALFGRDTIKRSFTSWKELIFIQVQQLPVNGAAVKGQALPKIWIRRPKIADHHHHHHHNLNHHRHHHGRHRPSITAGFSAPTHPPSIVHHALDTPRAHHEAAHGSMSPDRRASPHAESPHPVRTSQIHLEPPPIVTPRTGGDASPLHAGQDRVVVFSTPTGAILPLISSRAPGTEPAMVPDDDHALQMLTTSSQVRFLQWESRHPGLLHTCLFGNLLAKTL